MKKTDILGWLVNLHLFVMLMLMLKYNDNMIVIIFAFCNAAFALWFHKNIRRKEKETELDIIADKCDKVKGQWD